MSYSIATSALDGADISRSETLGSTDAFDYRQGERTLSFPYGDIFSFAWFVIYPESLVYGD